MGIRRAAWWIWIVLSAIWIVLLFLTGKYWCPLLFWVVTLQCTVESSFQELVSLAGVPLMMLGAGMLVGWIVTAVRSRISN